MKKAHYTIRRNLSLYMWHYFFRGFTPYAVIGILFFESVTDSFIATMSIFATVFVSISLFEIPFGVFSDQYLGRRKTMILGAFLWVISAFLFAFGGELDCYFLLFLGAVSMGGAEALFSGTEESLLYESVDELRKKKIFHEIYGHCRSMMQIGLAVGTILSFAIAAIFSLQITMWFSFVVSFGLLVVSFLLVEPKCTNLTRARFFSHAKEAFELIKINPLVRKITFARFLNYSAGEVLYRFEVAFFYTLIPLWAIGIARLERQVLGVFSFWYSGSLLSRFSFKKLLPLSVFSDVFIRFWGLILNSVATPFVLPFSNLVFGVEMTASDTLLQREFSNAQRATMVSLISLGVNICTAVLYVIIGFVAEWTNPLLAMFCALGFKIASVPLYFKIAKQIKD